LAASCPLLRGAVRTSERGARARHPKRQSTAQARHARRPDLLPENARQRKRQSAAHARRARRPDQLIASALVGAFELS
jgi:hypothetical protein